MGKWDDPEYRSAYFRAYNAKRADAHKTYSRQHRQDHLEEYREKDRQYGALHREQKSAANKLRYTEKKDSIRTVNKAWYQANKEKMREYNAQYRTANRDRLMNIDEPTREKRRAQNREWFRNHPEYNRAKVAAYRAMRAAVTIGKVDYNAVIARGDGQCGICKHAIDSSDITFDHVIPLSKGGPHCTENLQVAHFRCNAGKRDRMPT